MQRSLILGIAACLTAPGIGSAQVVLPDEPSPPPPAIRLFKEAAPESSGRSIESLKSSSWWEPPAGNNEIPRWALGHTFSLNTAGGLALSAGFFGRRADPLPLFLSQGVGRDTLRLASNSVTEPSTYRFQWDAKFGVAAPVWKRPQLKIDAIGEVFVPLTGPTPTDRPAPFQKSPAFRFGVATGF